MKKFESIEEAQAAFDSQSEELDAVKKESQSKTEGLNKLQADLKEKDAIIADMRKSKSTGGAKTFSLGKKKYLVDVAQFKFENVEHTAEDLLKDKELQAKLVEAKVGFLIEQE